MPSCPEWAAKRLEAIALKEGATKFSFARRLLCCRRGFHQAGAAQCVCCGAARARPRCGRVAHRDNTN